MNTKLKALLLAGLLFLICSKSYSQASLSYYSSSLPKIGLGYDFNERWWSEFRLYSNTSINDITPELVFCYNLVQKESHAVYAGLGGNYNYFSGIVLPVGVQFIPVEKLKRFSLHIEFQPMADGRSEDFILQGSWGLRYKFGK